MLSRSGLTDIFDKRFFSTSEWARSLHSSLVLRTHASTSAYSFVYTHPFFPSAPSEPAAFFDLGLQLRLREGLTASSFGAALALGTPALDAEQSEARGKKPSVRTSARPAQFCRWPWH